MSNARTSFATKRKALVAFLQEGQPSDVEVEVYYQNRGRLGVLGVRIAEISYTRKRPNGVSGASYMRADVDAKRVILAAEDFLLDYDIPSELGEAKEVLAYCLGPTSARGFCIT